MLHGKKSQSILQWFNALTTKGDVHSLAQFTDGSHFYEIVAFLQPFRVQGSKEGNVTGDSVIFSETSIACVEEVTTSVEGEAIEGKMETSVSESASANPFVIKDSDHTDTHKKYEVIRKFIDDFYHVQSSLLIDFKECQNGKEMELAKVAIFLLSAMIQCFLSDQNEIVKNTTLLDPEIQANIQECASLVLEEKDQLKKAELHRVLSRAANYKATPVRKQPSRSTPDVNDSSEGIRNVPKKRRERTSIAYEDPQESPMKILLDSPKIQYKAAVYKKDSELAKLRSALHDEENKVMDLTLEKSNLNNELKKEKKEVEFYKKELKLLRQSLSEKEEQEKLKDEELKDKKTEEGRLKKIIETLEEDIKMLKESNEALQEKVAELEKKPEQNVITSLNKENSTLKIQIQTLEIDNEEKAKTIKTLNEKITLLESDLKEYKEFSKSKRIVHSNGNKQSPRTSVDRKEQEMETKDGRMKQHAMQHRGESSKNNLESLQVMVEHLHRENETLKKKLESYESKYGSVDDTSLPRDSNSIKNEIDKTGAVSGEVSDRSAPCSSKQDDNNRREAAPLWANVPGDANHSRRDAHANRQLDQGRVNFDKGTLLNIVLQLERKNSLAPTILRFLKNGISSITDAGEFSARLQDLFVALSHSPGPTVSTRRSRSITVEEVDTSALILKNLNKEQENQVLKQNMRALRMSSKEREEELQMTIANLEASNAELKKEMRFLQQEVDAAQEKYANMEELVKKKDMDIKKTLMMFQKVYKAKRKECCERCKELEETVKELTEEENNYIKERAQLKMAKEDLLGTIAHLKYEIKELKKENKKMEMKLFEGSAALSRNISERDSLMWHYLKDDKQEAARKFKDQELKKKEAVKNLSRPILKVDAYILNRDNEPCTSNSVLSSRSFRSGYFKADDEDDFLNESSLAEIHNGGIPEEPSAESRLQEIRRRNTLCPPHLQSSYPLEIQDMTPSEKKYYDPDEVSFDLGRRSSLYQGKREFHKKSKSKYSDSDDEDSCSFPVKKRKIAEAETMTVPVSKGPCQTSSNQASCHTSSSQPRAKPSTPLKRAAAALFRRQSTFKTPSSVHRLMRMHRKSKAH